MMNTLSKFVFGICLLSTLACGDNAPKGAECGDGTTEADGVCVSDEDTGFACGTGTVEDNGECVLDGTELDCGPGTVAANGECVLDGTELDCGPGTVAANGLCVLDGTELDCGAGTFEFNGECVTVDPNDTTAPTTTVTPNGGDVLSSTLIRLETNEPATIFYTVDGSVPGPGGPQGTSPTLFTGLQVAGGPVTLRYFAVDPANNSEVEQNVIFTLDLPPGPVTNMAVAANAPDFDVSWTNPTDADLAGVVVVRTAGLFAGEQPVDGVQLAVGGSVGPHEIVFVGTAEAVSESGLLGFQSYVAWAFDTNFFYSAPRSDSAHLALPQIGTILLDLDANTATVITQPDNLFLTTANPVHNEGADFRFDLELANTSAGLSPAPKLLITSTQGDLVGDGAIAGTRFTSYGVFSLADGSARTRGVTINGITATTGTVILTVTFRTNPLLLTRSSAVDATTGATEFILPGFGRPARTVRSTEDGSRALLVEKNRGELGIVDLTSGAVSSVTVAAGLASGGGVAVSGGIAYFAVTRGAHYNSGDGGNNGGIFKFNDFNDSNQSEVQLAVISLASLEVIDVIALAGSSSDRPVARHVAISPDGSTVAVVLGRFNLGTNEVWFIDTATNSIIDTDSGTAGDQPANLSSDVGAPQTALFSNDGASLLVDYHNTATGDQNSRPVTRNGGDGSTAPDIDVVDTTTFVLSQITAPIDTTTGGVMLQLGDNLIYPTSAGVSKIALATGLGSVLVDTGRFAGAVLDPDGVHYWLSGAGGGRNCRIERVQVSDDAVVGLDNGDGAIGGECGNPHGAFAITPF